MVAGIPENVLPLMKPFTNRVDETIKPGLTMLNWTSLNVHSCEYNSCIMLWVRVYSVVHVIAFFNSMQTLKFKPKVTIMFYAAVNHYRNGHPKAETNKMDQNPPITTQECGLLSPPKYCTYFLRGSRHDWWQRKPHFAWCVLNSTVRMLLKNAVNVGLKLCCCASQ